MIITTTPSLEGWEIKAYLGPVTSHVVAGTGLFSDVAAAFSDVFGGRSRSYQRQLASIREEALSILEQEARYLGGNCILGLRVDFDEMSGGGKSMLMVTAMGTAARVTPTRQRELGPGPTKFVPAADVQLRRQTLDFVERAEAGAHVFHADGWDFITKNRVAEAAPYVLAHMKTLLRTGLYADTANRVREYLASLAPEKAEPVLFEAALDEEAVFRLFARTVIHQLGLLDLSKAVEALRSDDFQRRAGALQLVRLDPAYYTPQDLSRLEEAAAIAQSDAFQERGQRFTKEKTFSSVEMWRCECGYEMKADVHDRCAKCRRDIYGFEKGEMNAAQALPYVKQKLEVLRGLFSESLASEPQ